MGVHDGHRERMRERFLKYGLDNFSEIEALELLLFYAIPRRDTNPIAHALLERFGSLDEVLHASVEELCELPQITPYTAALLRAVPQLARMSELKRAAGNGAVADTAEAVRYLRPYFRYEREEVMLMLCLDALRRVRAVETVSRGVVNGVSFDVRRVVELALKRKAVSVILAHNHPDGPALPSHEDDLATSHVFRALQTVGIELLDHLILAGEDFTSYRESGTLDLYRFGY